MLGFDFTLNLTSDERSQQALWYERLSYSCKVNRHCSWEISLFTLTQ